MSMFLLLFLNAVIQCAPLSNTSPKHPVLYFEQNTESGRKVEQWKAESGVNPEELGDYFEGDIVFTNVSKNGLMLESRKWKDAVIPFEINGYFRVNEVDLIIGAMEDFHKYTCLQFRKRQPDDRDWISLTNTFSGCWSNVGRIGGRQDLNLQSLNCFKKRGTILHELLHAVGFYHEQNRRERDSYVTIVLQNVEKGKEGNFEKVPNSSGYGVAYDYASVLHYSEKAFSSNNNPTILVKKPGTRIGQRQGFSQGDVDKIRRMYNCGETGIVPEINESSYETQNSVGGPLAEIVSLLFPKRFKI